MLHPLLVTAVVALATWDGWRWYAGRIWASPEEAIVPSLMAAFLVAIGRPRWPWPKAPHVMPLGLVMLALAAYAISFAVLPPIVRAAIAVGLTLYCFSFALLGRRPPIAFWGMIALALPVLPSLQFVFGYPMRIVSAALTVVLLQAQGFLIRRDGTFLVWQDKLVQFDAPCSGVSMLWASLLLTFMVSVLFRFGIAKTVVATGIAILLSLAGNVLRASSLFYIEAGFVANAPWWWHDGIGLAAFVMSSAATLWLLNRLRTTEVLRWAS